MAGIVKAADQRADQKKRADHAGTPFACLTSDGAWASMRHPFPGAQFMTVSQEAMNALLRPRTIAVVGASTREGSVGRALMTHCAGPRFTGQLFGIHPTNDSALGSSLRAAVR